MSAGANPRAAWPLAGGGVSHFDQLCSTQHLFASWHKFARGKRGKPDVQVFERNLETNIFNLRDELKEGRYHHVKYQPFVVHDPRRRQIHKAGVRDRLVHQAIFDAIEPDFERQFIFDSFSCRQGKGTHAGVKRLRQHLRRASRNDSHSAYALKCDIHQFFASVEHAKLLNLLSNFVTDEKVLKLLEAIINSFGMDSGKGIPLGNVTSQLFANVYMHQLDHFVKHNLRWRFYLRYCDDFIFVGPSRQELLDMIEPVSLFLHQELRLNMHPDKISIRTWAQGIDFLGYVLKPNCTVLRTKTKNRILRRVSEDNLSSYLGLCYHADSYELHRLIKTIV